MPPRTEVAVDHGVRRQDPLRLLRRFEPLHLSLTAPGWPVRVLGAVVEVATGSVFHLGQQLTMCNPVAAQAIGDDALGLVLQAGEQALEEPLGGRGTVAFRRPWTRMPSTTPC